MAISKHDVFDNIMRLLEKITGEQRFMFWTFTLLF